MPYSLRNVVKNANFFRRLSSHCEEFHCCTGWQPHLLLFRPNNYFNVFESGSISGGSIFTLWPAELALVYQLAAVRERSAGETALERASSLSCAKKKTSTLVISNDDLTLFHSNLSLPKVAFQNEIPNYLSRQFASFSK